MLGGYHFLPPCALDPSSFCYLPLCLSKKRIIVASSFVFYVSCKGSMSMASLCISIFTFLFFILHDPGSSKAILLMTNTIQPDRVCVYAFMCCMKSLFFFLSLNSNNSSTVINTIWKIPVTSCVQPSCPGLHK